MIQKKDVKFFLSIIFICANIKYCINIQNMKNKFNGIKIHAVLSKQSKLDKTRSIAISTEQNIPVVSLTLAACNFSLMRSLMENSAKPVLEAEGIGGKPKAIQENYFKTFFFQREDQIEKQQENVILFCKFRTSHKQS